MLFPLIESIDFRQRCGFGLALFVCRPVFEGGFRMCLHMVLDDRGVRVWFRKTLPCKQVYTNEQAKKDRADQWKSDKFLLS